VADRGVLIPESLADRFLNATRIVEQRFAQSLGGPKTQIYGRFTDTFVGHIVEKGPEDSADFGDHRYWVERLLFSVPGGGRGERDAVQTTPERAGPVTERIVPVTNLAEELTRGHLLWLDQSVIVHAAWEEGDRQFVRWFMSAAPQPWLWVKIVGADRIDPNQWIYSGVRQVLRLAQNGYGDFVDGTGFYARTIHDIINPAEAYNDGSNFEGNSIDVTRLPDTCELVPIRGEPVVPVAPTWIPEDGVVWSIIGYPNSVDQV